MGRVYGHTTINKASSIIPGDRLHTEALGETHPSLSWRESPVAVTSTIVRVVEQLEFIFSHIERPEGLD